MINWFQSLLSKFNLYRYNMERMLRDTTLGSLLVGPYALNPVYPWLLKARMVW